MRARLPVMLALVLAGCGSDPAPLAAPDRSPEASARHFLDVYMDDDGRVVRRDEGGDTVSEGQAYAMLLAVALRDESRFDRAWAWSERELRRDDGLLAWRWHDGAVADDQPAADADVDAGRALLLAADAFGRPDLAADAARVRTGIERELLSGDRLLPGPWAREHGVVNPSYTTPRAFALLGLDRVTDRALADLAELDGLPPDWVSVQDGVRPTGPPPGGAQARYGFDAARVPVRLAEACEPAARKLASALWPLLRENSATLPRALDGAPAGDGEHPVALVAAAAAAHAAGDTAARDRLLDEAQDHDARQPTYYGAAWVALGRVMLQTERLADELCEGPASTGT